MPSYDQNLLVDAGILLQDCEDADDWTTVSGTVAADAVNYKVGTGGIKFTMSAASTTAATCTVDADISDADSVWFWAYCPEDPYVYILRFVVRVSSVEDLSKQLYASRSFRYHAAGWTRVTVPTSAFVAANGESWDNQMIRLRVDFETRADCATYVTIDDVRFGVESAPVALIVMDDARITQYTVGFPLLESYDVKGTAYITSSEIDIDREDRCTTAQLQEMYAAGWDIANHYSVHDYDGDLTQAEIEVYLRDCRNYLDWNDMPRASAHVAYPGGLFTDNILAAMTNQSMTTGRVVAVKPATLPFDDARLIPTVANSIDADTVLVTLEGQCDDALARGGFPIVLIHDFDDDTVPIISGLVEYLQAEGVHFMTISEFYQATLSPSTWTEEGLVPGPQWWAPLVPEDQSKKRRH